MIKTIQFGHQAIDYIREELFNGDALAHLLLKLPLETGHVISYVPAELNEQDIPPFNQSIFLTKSIEISHAVPAETGQFISSYLQLPGERYAIFETLGEVGDPWIKLKNIVYFSFNSIVYLFLTKDTSNEKIKSAMGTARGYPFVCILTNFNAHITNLEEFNEEKLEELAKSVDYMIVGAFDQESYLIWSKV